MENQDYQDEKREVKRLFRSRKNKVIGGICGGLADYFEVDVVIIRILFVLLALIQGVGFLIYLVALFVIPVNPNETASRGEAKSSRDRSRNVLLFLGIVLVLLGIYYTMGNLFYFPDFFYSIPFRMHWDLFWPLLLILIGVLYIIHITQKDKISTKKKDAEPVKSTNGKRLFRSRKDRKIAGVCSGLAAYFDIDPTIIRVLWVILTIFLGAIFLGILVYIVMALVVPEGDYEDSPSN